MNPAQLNLNPLTQMDPILIVSIMAIFVATYFAMGRFFVRPYLAVLEERERLFTDADEAYRRADEAEGAASREAQRMLDECGRECDELRTASRDRREAYQRERLSQATTEASAILEKGRAEISFARASQSDALRKQVTDCVGLACTRLLGDSDADVVATAVDRAMARRMG